MADTKIVGGRGIARAGKARAEECAPSDCAPQNCVPTAAFKNKTTTIYARAHGSDECGDGSHDCPFRTFQRAIRFVPSLVDPGRRFIVDITGIGTEDLPDGYVFPSIATNGSPFPVDASIPYFWAAQVVTVRALPQQVAAIPAAQAVITNVSGTARNIAALPQNLITLTIVNGAASYAAWAGGALKGKMIIRTENSPSTLQPAYQASCTIADSAIVGSDAVLTLNKNAFSFNGGVGPLLIDAGDIRIVEPSAILRAAMSPTDIFDIFGDGLGAFGTNINSINFQGLGLQTIPAVGQPFHPSCSIFGADISSTFELCDIDGFSTIGPNGGIYCMLYGCKVTTAIFSPSSDLNVQGCQLSGIFFWFLVNNDYALTDSSIENSVPFGTSGFGIATFPTSLHLQNVRSVGAFGAAIEVQGGRLDLVSVSSDGAFGDALSVRAGAYAEVRGFVGAGNGGRGITADDASLVKTDTATTVTGSLPGVDDVKSGSLAAVSYAALAAFQQYDVQPAEIAAGTATGTRIVQSL